MNGDKNMTHIKISLRIHVAILSVKIDLTFVLRQKRVTKISLLSMIYFKSDKECHKIKQMQIEKKSALSFSLDLVLCLLISRPRKNKNNCYSFFLLSK